MNRTSTDKIRSATSFLIRFRCCLPQPIQSFMRPYLDQPYQLALQVLDCCSASQPIAMGEVAQRVGVTRETVRQVLLALKEGGMAFNVCSRQGWQLMENDYSCGELRSDWLTSHRLTADLMPDLIPDAPLAAPLSDVAAPPPEYTSAHQAPS